MPTNRASRTWIAEHRSYTLTGIREALGITKTKFLNALKEPAGTGYVTGSARGQAYGIGAAVAAAAVVILGPKLKPRYRRILFLDRRLRRYVVRLLSARPGRRRPTAWLVIRSDDRPEVTSRTPPWSCISLNLNALATGLFKRLLELAGDPDWKDRHVREPDRGGGGTQPHSTGTALVWDGPSLD